MITQGVVMDTVALHRQGHSMRFIAKKLGLHRNTVKKFILGKRLPKHRRRQRRASVMAPFVRIIQNWLDQDSYRASWILRRLIQIDYEGSYETVHELLAFIKLGCSLLHT
jgi:transposase